MTRDRYDDCVAYLDSQLAKLMNELGSQGRLKDTVVIITADHGESFGEHGLLGHASSLHLEQTRVPLVILGSGVPMGRIVREPVSLRDLPATVADQLGLAEGAPFPGRSLASYWRATPGESPPGTTPALSEIANATAFEPQKTDGPGRVGFQMSLVDQGRHYVRDGSGEEHLYDLRTDPSENVDLVASPEEGPMLGLFRKKLFEILSAERGSEVVEGAYLTPYRSWLRSLVRDAPPQEAISAVGPKGDAEG